MIFRTRGGPTPCQETQLPTPRRRDTQKAESREQTDNMPLVPVNAASITTAKIVVHGVVPDRIERFCTTQNLCSSKMITLFGQHLHFIHSFSRFRSASCVGTPHSVFRAGYRLLPFFFFFSILRRMGKNKGLAHLITLPRIFIRVVCRLNSVAFATQR